MDGRSGAGGGSCGVVDRGEWTGRGGNGEYGATAITNLSREEENIWRALYRRKEPSKRQNKKVQGMSTFNKKK